MTYKEKEEVRKGYVHILKQNNTKYFLTTTFKYDVTYHQTLETGKLLVKMLRKDCFNRNKDRDFLKGYVIIEYQRSGRPHLHFLISDHPIFLKIKHPFTKIVHNKCRNLKLIDEKKGVRIEEYYDHTLEKYLTKSIEKEQDNFDFVKELTYDGF